LLSIDVDLPPSFRSPFFANFQSCVAGALKDRSKALYGYGMPLLCGACRNGKRDSHRCVRLIFIDPDPTPPTVQQKISLLQGRDIGDCFKLTVMWMRVLLSMKGELPTSCIFATDTYIGDSPRSIRSGFWCSSKPLVGR
jgi:hypothetical protein